MDVFESLRQVIIGVLFIISGAWYSDGYIVNNVDNGKLYSEQGQYMMNLLTTEDKLLGDWYVIHETKAPTLLFTIEKENETLIYKQYRANGNVVGIMVVQIAFGMNFKGFDLEKGLHRISVVFHERNANGTYNVSMHMVDLPPLFIVITQNPSSVIEVESA